MELWDLTVCNEDAKLGDERLTRVRHTDTAFAPSIFSTREALEKRREELQYNLRLSAGLYPWPEKTPLNPKFEDVGDYEGYCVKKVMYESRPGLWGTGNLYLPKPLRGPAPAILNVIGHWADQRLTRIGDELKTAADYPQQLANFARMGFVCLVVDMVGRVDSRQVTHEYGTGERELYTSNSLGIQLWNNIRAVDLLCDMPEVDENRIGMTGASGGGTQSLLLALADERIRAVAPINMISLCMQGGCVCENAPGLRRETTNGEMCAMLAPRPLFLAGSTGDWTSNLLTCELPMMRRAYSLYDAQENVEYIYQHRDHQYNSVTRHEVYQFFARHLMGKEIVWEEAPVQVDDLQDLTWFRGNGKAPGFENDEEFFAAHCRERNEQVGKLPIQERLQMLRWMTDTQKERFPQMIRRTEVLSEEGMLEKGLLADGHGAQIPFAMAFPKGWDRKKAALILSDKGKTILNSEQVREKLAQGYAVLSGDLFLTGEFDKEEPPKNRGIKHYTTFHNTEHTEQVRDICLLYRLAESRMTVDGQIWLEAQGDVACVAACAAALLPNLAGARLDHRVRELTENGDYMEKCFIPGIGVLGGIPGCLALTDASVSYI